MADWAEPTPKKADHYDLSSFWLLILLELCPYVMTSLKYYDYHRDDEYLVCISNETI